MKGFEQIRSRLALLWERNFTHGIFFRNTLWMTAGLGLRTVVQIIYFIIVARTLQPEAFGIFAGMQALINFFGAFATWGSGNIMIKRVSRQPDVFPTLWGNALLITLIFSSILGTAACLVSGAIYSIDMALQVAVPIVLGDVAGLSLLGISVQAFQVFQKLSHASMIWVLLSVSRLAMALFLFLSPIPKSIQIWALLYGASGLLAAGVSLLWVRLEIGWGPLNIKAMQGEWREGLYYCVGYSAQGVYNDIDKTLLSRITGGAIAGAYSSAYRFLDAAFIPVRALIVTGFPRFFKEGGKSLKDARLFAQRLIPWAVAWASFAWLTLALASPFIPILLGAEYTLASNIIIWLGPILIFRAIHFLQADSLTGSGFQGLRTTIQIIIAIINFGLNLWLIPRYGWMGAMMSSLISDGGLVLVYGLSIPWLEKKQKFA